MVLSPLEIETLLAVYAHPSSLTLNSAQRQAIDRFIDAGLMKQYAAHRLAEKDTEYKLTEKGAFYVEQGLCSLPFPVVTYAIPSIAAMRGDA